MNTAPDQQSFLGVPCTKRVAGPFTLGHWVAGGVGARPQAHGHAEAHFIYVPEGIPYITAARGERARNGANLIFNPAGTYHRDRLTRAGAFFSISLSAASTDLLEELLVPDGPTQIGRPDCHMVINQLMRLCTQWTRDAAVNGEALCLELIARLIQPNRERRPPRWLDRAVEILRAEFTGEISITEVAKRVGVHPVHLARAFRAHLGRTPGAYLLNLRVDRAAAMLDTTGLSAAEIALATGFSDQSHFSKQFRRSVGIPPGKYRRLIARDVLF